MKILLNKGLEKYQAMPLEVKASFWFLVSAIFQRGISVVTTPIFTRLMSSSEYGEFSVFYSWYGIACIIVTLNLFFGVYVRGLVKYEDDRDAFSSSMQGLALTLTLFWLGIYFVFRPFFNALLSLDTIQMLCMFLIIAGNSAYSFWAAEHRVDLIYKPIILLSVATAIVMPLLQIALMMVMTDKVMARIYGMAAVFGICYLPLLLPQMLKGKRFYSAAYWKYAIMFNLPLLPHYLSQIVLNSADRLMINEMVGASEAGIYSLAYSISQIMTVFNSALMQTMEPWLYKKIKARELGEISKAAYPSFLLIASVNIILIAFAPEVVNVFAPAEYHDAIWVIPPVAMSVFFQFAYTFFAVFEFYYEKTQYITLATAAGALLNIGLNYVFIQLFGYYAAGYTTLVCFMLYSVFHYLFMKKLIRVHHPGEEVYNTKKLVYISVLLLAIGFVFLASYGCPPMRYSLIILLVLVLIARRRDIIRFIKSVLVMRKPNA